MSLTRFSGSARLIVYCAALLAFTASILVVIGKNGGSRSASAQDGRVVEAPAAIFTNAAPVTFDDGPANLGDPYPSTINVTGLSGNISNTAGSVKVTINNFSHTFPNDLTYALVGPGGQALLLADEVGDDPDMVNVTFTISDTGVTQLPNSAAWVAGTYRPAGYFAGDVSMEPPGPQAASMGHPGPAHGGTATFSSVFGGTAPNGTWSLYAIDYFSGDGGTFAGGWSLEITTDGVGPTPTPLDALADFDADGKTDPTVIRVGATANSGATWWIKKSNGPYAATQWGIASDIFIPADYDGDLKDDVAIWRPGTQGQFYIIRSTNSTFRIDDWGVNGDDPTVVGDYNGDNIDDVAVYRQGTTALAGSTWWWKVEGGGFTQFQWGVGMDFPAPGDYDGDNKMDYAIQRPNGADGEFWIWSSLTQTYTSTTFGGSLDLVVPGDYDNDRKTDIAVLGTQGGNWLWRFRPSAGGPDFAFPWGNVVGDLPAPGDYDGDGTADLAIWRHGAQSTFYAMSPNDTEFMLIDWGVNDDEPVTYTYVH